MDINSIPSEILAEILGALKVNCFSSLATSLRVTKTWYNVALPFLYRDVILSQQLIIPFVDSVKDEHCTLIRTFTVKDCDYESYIPKLARILPNFIKLSTFSLTADFLDDGLFGNQAIVSLVDVLPESCINLELVVDFHFDDDEDKDVQVFAESHICDSVRRIIPGMENVRLSLPYMCSALCTQLSYDTNRKTNIPKPISLQKLKNLTICCSYTINCHREYDDPIVPFIQGGLWS